MRSTTTLLFAGGCSALVAGLSCHRTSEGNGSADGGVTATGAIVIRPASAAGDSGQPRPGMAFVPPGVLRVGTPPERAPRVPDEEPAGEPVQMGGFYIDLLPYPNEPGAIPTSNVTRDEAAQLCSAKGKRLCTELEWERACKGPENVPYEYGETYRASACGTGVTSEEAARRPTAERLACKSAFGVSDMHGTVWEWTDSDWGRSAKDPSLAVLRGGNAAAGELVGRCANAIARPSMKRSPTMGLRCCAGTRNEAHVQLTVKGAPTLEALKAPEELHAVWEPVLRPTLGVQANTFARAWKWSPVLNEDLVLILACHRGASSACTLVVGRPTEGAPAIVASADVGLAVPLPDLARIGDLRHLRLRGIDGAGTFGRDISYTYGRVDIGKMNRP